MLCGELDLAVARGCRRRSRRAAWPGSAGCSAACAARGTCWRGTRTCTSSSVRTVRLAPRSSRRASSISALVCCSSRCCRWSSSDWLLELSCERLRLLEQLLGAHRGHDRVEHDADGLDDLLEEHLVDVAERMERRQLDHAEHLLLEHDGEHDDVAGSDVGQPGAELGTPRRGTRRRIGLRFDGRLADERLAHGPHSRRGPCGRGSRSRRRSGTRRRFRRRPGCTM